METRSVSRPRYHRSRHRAASLLIAAFLAGTPLVGCGGEGTSTRCSLSSCIVTFQRGVDANVNILGAELRLVDVTGDQATVEVAGQQVQLQVNQRTQLGGWQLSLLRVTEQQVVVEITQGGGEGGG